MQGYRLTHMLARRPGPLSGFSNGLRSSRPLAPPPAPAAPASSSPTIASSTRPGANSPSPLAAPGTAPFSTTSAALKKKNRNATSPASSSTASGDTANTKDPYAQYKSESSDLDDEDPSNPSSVHPAPSPNDLSTFPDLDSRFARAADRFTDLVRKLRSGQTSMAISSLSSVRVKPDKNNPATYPLRELASVVPRAGSARMVSILVHDPAYVKPIMSAIQGSPDWNQQPQRTEDNELELTMKVPRESPEALAGHVRAAAHAYKEAVRMARQRREKVHQRWGKDGTWLPDVKYKADKELQKKVEKKNAEIDKLEAQTLKSVASMRSE